MFGEIKDRPNTPFEVSDGVFRETPTLYERCFALTETLDHLALEGGADTGRARRSPDAAVVSDQNLRESVLGYGNVLFWSARKRTR
jgi:hypothetical protein